MALRDEFKAAMGSWATGVAVLTANDGGFLYGITVNSLTSVSLDPPLVLVCVNKENRIPEMIRHSGRFALSVLRADQGDAAKYFATPGREPTKGFVVVEGDWTVLRQPIVKDAMAHIVCELHAEHDGGDHIILVGHVLHAHTDVAANPLTYWRRVYRTFG